MARTASSRVNGHLALIVLSSCSLASAALAEVRITKSDEPTIAKGAVVANDAILDIPATKTVRVLLLPTGISKVIIGPYKGTAVDYIPSAMPAVDAKPAAEYDFGTTVNSPPPRQ